MCASAPPTSRSASTTRLARLANNMADDKRGILKCDAGSVRFKLLPAGTELQFANGDTATVDQDMIELRSVVSPQDAEQFRNDNGLIVTEEGQLALAE